jgi:hypothetical protein
MLELSTQEIYYIFRSARQAKIMILDKSLLGDFFYPVCFVARLIILNFILIGNRNGIGYDVHLPAILKISFRIFFPVHGV